MKIKILITQLVILCFSSASFAGFTDGSTFLTQNDKNAWQKIDAFKKALTDAFDGECGDSWCEGDFGNLTSMDIECSVEESSGNIKSCVWSFAGTSSLVDEKTGDFKNDHTIQFCKFAPKTTINDLMDKVLSANKKAWYETLDVELPGMKKNIRDVLNDCL